VLYGCANAIKQIITQLENRLVKPQTKDTNIKLGVPKHIETQTLDMSMDYQVEGKEPSSDSTEKRLILARISKIEEMTQSRQRIGEEQEKESWTTVVKRRNRKEDQSREEERGKKDPPVSKVNIGGTAKSREKEDKIKAYKKKMPKGAGVLVEIQDSTQKDYEEVVEECQKRIS